MIEPLESRIAPASIAVGYTDLDGDLVRITASKAGAVAPPLDATDLVFVGGGTSGQLAALNLLEAGFDGARIVFTVTKKPGGDALAHVGFINAIGFDLDQVIVKGDLGRIFVGDATTAGDPGLNLLQVRTMGALGLVTQGGAGDLDSSITGRLGALRVAGDFTDAFLNVFAATAADGQIGSVVIGGDLTGGTDSDSGLISSSGAIGPVTIGGDVTGGSGASSGLVRSTGAMGAVKIGGNVTGGPGDTSGKIFSFGAMGSVQVGGGLIGGPGNSTGQIHSFGAMGAVTIGRSVLGGAGDSTGQILGGAIGDVRIGGSLVGGSGNVSGVVQGGTGIGHVRIGGDVVGGSITDSASLSVSGAIVSFGAIKSITIGGSLIAGSDDSTGTLTRSGTIEVGDSVGPVKISRSILGNVTNPAVIFASGQAVKPLTGFDTAIASLTVGGDVRFARILAGFDSFQTPTNADASIGAVSVGRDWVASSLVAGAEDTGADGFGINDDLQTVTDTVLIARIASIAITGNVAGSLGAGDHFGFVAQQIGSFKAAGFTAPLLAATANQNIAVRFTNDVRILEVS